jgi:hypothetical protein
MGEICVKEGKVLHSAVGIMMYISHWLKLGGGELAHRYWNVNFLLDKGRTERMG